MVKVASSCFTGMSKEDAMKAYVSKANELITKYGKQSSHNYVNFLVADKQFIGKSTTHIVADLEHHCQIFNSTNCIWDVCDYNKFLLTTGLVLKYPIFKYNFRVQALSYCDKRIQSFKSAGDVWLLMSLVRVSSTLSQLPGFLCGFGVRMRPGYSFKIECLKLFFINKDSGIFLLRNYGYYKRQKGRQIPELTGQGNVLSPYIFFVKSQESLVEPESKTVATSLPSHFFPWSHKSVQGHT